MSVRKSHVVCTDAIADDSTGGLLVAKGYLEEDRLAGRCYGLNGLGLNRN